MYFDIVDSLSFSFPFPQVPYISSSITNMFYICVYDYVCFCVYIYPLNLSSTCERKHEAFVTCTVSMLISFFCS
jgi:hypothetical protein